MFGCAAAAQVKTSRETKGQFLSVNMAFSVGVMSAMYLCRAVSGKMVIDWAVKEKSFVILPFFRSTQTDFCFNIYTIYIYFPLSLFLMKELI